MKPTKRNLAKSFCVGYVDGLDASRAGEDLSMGMTYDDDKLNEWYDFGVNVGIVADKTWTLDNVATAAMILFTVCVCFAFLALGIYSYFLSLFAIPVSILSGVGYLAWAFVRNYKSLLEQG